MKQKGEYTAGNSFSDGKTAFFFLLLLFVSLSLLWPGDLFWGKPGPWQTLFWNYPEQIETIKTALQANKNHELAVSGVKGSMPVVYHPFHVWIYQLLLRLTPDLTRIVTIKQLINLSLSLFGIIYLARLLAFPVYPVLLILFSPFLYLYSRQLSDDPWLIPLSLMAFCCYGWFSRNQRRLPVIVGGVVLSLMFFIHPRGLVPALGLFFVFVLFERRWIRWHLWGAGVFLGITLIVVLPAFWELYNQLHAPADPGGPSLAPLVQAVPGREIGDPEITLLTVLFPLISGGMYYSYDFLALFPDATLEAGCLPPSITRLLVAISMSAYLMAAGGLLLTVSRLIQMVRKRRPGTLEDRLGAAALVMIALFVVQTLIFLKLKKFYPPDYHLGVWFAYFYFIWRALFFLQGIRRARVLIPIYITAMAVLWVNMVLTVHLSGDYNLGRGIGLARRIAGYSPYSDVILFADFNGELTKELDALANNADHSLMGFYYRPYIREIKMFIDKMNRHQGNLLAYSLNPLVLHYRQMEKTDLSAPRTLIIKWRQEKGHRRLVLVDNPATVRNELNGTALRGRN